MARQRPPILLALPFTYWVFGRPVSTRNEDGGKPTALPKWRGTVTTALSEVLDAVTKRRGAIPIENLVEVHVCWLSIDPSDQAQPDIDNMLKPLIDAFNERIIVDDRQVHRIVAEKASINSPPEHYLDVMDKIQDDDRFVTTGEVIVIRLLDFDRELRP